MDDSITASGNTLMRQAPMTAEVYLQAAIKAVESHFGAGSAAQHSAIIAAFMNASALDYGASIIARSIERLAGRAGDIAEAVSQS